MPSHDDFATSVNPEDATLHVALELSGSSRVVGGTTRIPGVNLPLAWKAGAGKQGVHQDRDRVRLDAEAPFGDLGSPWCIAFFCGDPGRTRTLNLLIRSQLLYPVELPDRMRRHSTTRRHHNIGCQDPLPAKRASCNPRSGSAHSFHHHAARTVPDRNADARSPAT